MRGKYKRKRERRMQQSTTIHKIDENRYQAHIGFQGERYYLGTFPTLEEAIKARQRGEQMHLDFLEKYYRELGEGKDGYKV